MELPEMLLLHGRGLGKSISMSSRLEVNFMHYLQPGAPGYSREELGSWYSPEIQKAMERHFARQALPPSFPAEYIKQAHPHAKSAVGSVVYDKYTSSFRYVPNPGYEDQPVNLTISASAGRGTATINGVETTIFDSSKIKIDLRLRPDFKVLTSFKKPRTLQ